MPLSPSQKEELHKAIKEYSFPPEYYDFILDRPERLEDTRAVEARIKADLISGDMNLVKNGLSNVLYWGFARMKKIRDFRFNRFREKVTRDNLCAATELFHTSGAPSLIKIKDIGLPEFSGMSFVSKIRMFLDPEKSATLDRQIMKIHRALPSTVLANVHANPTQIPITAHNAEAYEMWCRKMREISERYFAGGFRAADIERGFFHLVQEGEVSLAGEILRDA
jgi:hypothetical protein